MSSLKVLNPDPIVSHSRSFSLAVIDPSRAILPGYQARKSFQNLVVPLPVTYQKEHDWARNQDRSRASKSAHSAFGILSMDIRAASIACRWYESPSLCPSHQPQVQATPTQQAPTILVCKIYSNSSWYDITIIFSAVG